MSDLASPGNAHSDAVAATGVGAVRKVFKHDGATQIEGLKRWGAFDDEDE